MPWKRKYLKKNKWL